MDYQENWYKRGTLPSKTYSRVEQYLRELCLLEDAPLPIPQSRIELLLEAMITGDMSKCETPKSRQEKLIWTLLTGDESNIERCASRIEVLWYCLVKGLNAEELLGTEVNGKVIEDCMSRIEAYLWYLIENGGISSDGVEYELYDFVTAYNTVSGNLLNAVSLGDTMVNIVGDEASTNEFNIPTLESKEYTVQNNGTNFTLNNVEYTHGITEKTIEDGSDELPLIPNGYSVDGYKSAILKGQTLVNLGQPQTGLGNNGYSNQGSSSGITNKNGFIHYAVLNSNTCPFIRLYSSATKKFFTTQSLKTSTKYMVVVKIDVSTTKTLNLIISPTGYTTTNKLGSTSLSQGMQFAKIIFDTPSSFNSNISLGTSMYSTSGDYVDVYWYQLFEYQDGMENWDIPYFTGMQGVRMPVLTTVGKNLLNNQNNSKDTTIDIDGTVKTFVGRTLSDYVKVSKNKQYTFSGTGNSGNYIAFFDNSKTFIERISASTFTPKQDGYIRVFQYNSVEALYQIEEGSKATSYERHKSNILSTPSDLELRGIDVQDTLDLITGKLINHYGERIVSEDDSFSTTVLDGKCTCVVDVKSKLSSYASDNFLTDKILHGSPNNTDFGIYQNLKNFVIYETGDDLEAFKSKVIGTKIYYRLAEPVHKTVGLSIVNQDGEPLDKLEYFNNGNISITSETINPSMTYEPNINSFKGTVNVGTVVNNVLTATDNDIVIVEGDKTNCYIPKFKGMVSCSDMHLVIENEDGSQSLNQYPINNDVVLRKVGDVEDTLNYLTGEYVRKIGVNESNELYVLDEPIITNVEMSLKKEEMLSFDGITNFKVVSNENSLLPSRTLITVSTSNNEDLVLLNNEIRTLSLEQNDTVDIISNTSEEIENISNGLNEINSLLE